MGSAININVKDENEFNQQMQMYLAQGYKIKSNFNGTAILGKKSYSLGLLIILIIFLFPIAIIYYLVASDDVVTIILSNGQSTTTSSSNSNAEKVVSYCTNCGQGLFKDSKFCPECGATIKEEDMKKTPQLEYSKVGDN
ncbi:zinc ribbon domain-containing protein [uncultured Methanobrevibacter sp.]|uniref:zinc ribbon domain-containing protein n=1 Tax=uncultured Methanobrevibacter sp. TaxID=253161 RepID=UPI002615B69C